MKFTVYREHSLPSTDDQIRFWRSKKVSRPLRSNLVNTVSHEGLSNLDETFREYSPAPTEDLIILWRSKVKITAGHRGGEGIHVNAGASESILKLFKCVICHIMRWIRCQVGESR